MMRIGGNAKPRSPAKLPAVLADAIPFQDDLGEIIEERPAAFLPIAFFAMVIAFLTLIVVTSLSSVDVVVLCNGTLATDMPTIVLQPIERSIITALNVKEGDTVTRGQVLATLDPTFAKADVRSLLVQQRSLAAQIGRVEAELNDVEFDPTGYPEQDAQLQQNIFKQHEMRYQERLRKIDEDTKTIQVNINSLGETVSSLSNLLAIAQNVEKTRADLVEDKVGSRLSLLDAQAARMRNERDLQGAVNRLAALRHDLKSKEAERQVFISDWRREGLENLVASRNELAKVAEAMSKAAQRQDLVMVTAPDDGTVLDVAKRSVGSVLQGAEPLVTIAPAKASLIAEILIASGDVGYTRIGDEVTLKVDAFPFQRHGMLHGELMSIGEETVTPTTPGSAGGGAFHRGRVKLSGARLSDLPEGAHLIQGMTLAADIKVGRRSIISYFISPLARSLADSQR